MIKNISIQQPWAGLLVLGIKHNETRSWSTKHLGILGIHSSAKMPEYGKELLNELCAQYPDKFFPGSEAYETCTKTGCVLGTVFVKEVCSTNEPKALKLHSLELMLGNYESDRFYWVCENPVMFEAPVPCKGALSLWGWDETVNK